MADALIIQLPNIPSAIALAGDREENLKLLSRQTGASLVLRGQELHIGGTEAQMHLADQLVRSLEVIWTKGNTLSSADILTARQALDSDRQDELQELQRDVLAKTRRGEEIRAKTFRQKEYIKDIRRRDLTFCIGPAGTGKTYLAVVVAVQALLNNQVEKLILTRPAVEAGEKLGFLPGDLQQKVNPYLRPLYDAIYEFIDPEKVPSLMERGVIEVAPLAYMRGRTLNHAFVIVDEAQNTTPAQMKMVLTRLGFRSRMVITGDTTQTDLPLSQKSGLAVALQVLKNVEGIGFCEFTQKDVVRHALVQRIVAAYERYER
ncbi:PhoH family protein [Nodularia spumigena CS-584]|jgi:phosphate starvation-inducible protein PhoH and related proteins|uniref:PhoH-like protein n=2 Tax=Nodularia spumigena TaxID=70799 RepID=A0A2S0Q840_NODSP|nr:PhoH family protein [Nodularia spumigena]AHJ27170.1 Phosphate starvation-inducible protein PhoH, predicted ATPase [Nodularia spumigena CCY9414]AVZ30537.1 PhoH-like protein [Nodularia spumigena UHCC 0039]EAW46009.1 PhoH-like protein [Nodularia spumigena CCY9414]MDB9381457.1 PhoH family protein [Nodularia spumigena CS-584]MEA5524884.1 PhoH family protein [Nodularia spumigena UHCC 0143]